MAVLSKIRERSLFLIIIIGLALFAFVLDPSTIGDFFNSSKVNEIGEVNGETISRQEFANALEKYRQQTGGRVSEMQAAKTVWDNLIRQKIYENQLEEAGITIGENDVYNEVVSAPFVQNNPQYQNEAGLFDESKFKQFLADTKENDPDLWSQWSSYMNQVRDNAQRETYNNLVSAGLGASLKEGENQYIFDNTKINAQFVYVPYTTIADSLIDIKKSEIEAYIKENENEFKVDASRDISYVQFNITATPEDEEVIKNNVANVIEDFKTAENNATFLSENDSDTQLNDNIQYKNFLNQEIADDIFSANEGDVVGPYKDRGYYKVSKITEVTQMPDSVKASHILIPFVGAQRVAPDVTRTEEEAKKLADSLLAVVKGNRNKFGELAREFSSDTGSAEKDGDLGYFPYNQMTPSFRDFTFENNEGDIDIVASPFGYHIIRIDDQKNQQKVIKMATYSKTIEPSEATENTAYQQAQEFALALTNGDKEFTELVGEKNYVSRPAVGLKVLDENVPGIGNQRQIVSWAFEKDTEVGDFKRFDLEGSYVIAILNNKTEKGLMPASKAVNTVRPILVNKKKAEMLTEKMNGNDLQEIAKANNVSVRTANDLNLKSPTISGVGVEPKVVGAMYNAKVDKVYTPIEGNRGVFAFKVTSKEEPVALPNYDVNRKRMAEQRKRATFKVYEAIKKASDIEDNRAVMYGAN